MESRNNKTAPQGAGETDMSHKGEDPDRSATMQIESRMEKLIGYILLVGVLASVALIAAGVIWHYAATRRLGMDYSISGMNLFRFVMADFAKATHPPLRPRLFVNLGIATLMLTPYVRVMASMIYFAFAAKNAKYTVFTAMVFGVLTYSLFLR